ncbi:hypothetical protein [Candidatus Uabimicrobium amorphum]|uniref:Uncharacterized protein n=1 Tax=Uabimicrobium amorphum TaxID=2596890 RepID=A0A5S9F3C3_UABAM|nr:hypothetical protein [Candidatus Uabimicrobium amorphum]BBM83284.1 hypothetical protein UABAM_01635 [Candidatus Uabimicrobium amorphum]
MKKNAFVIVLYLTALISFACVCFLARYYVPAYKEIFRDFGMALPIISIYSLMISDTIAIYFFPAIACALIITTVVWTLPSIAFKTVGFCFLILANTLLGAILYGGVLVSASHLQPASILTYALQDKSSDLSSTYQKIVDEAKSPQFVQELQNAPAKFLEIGIHALADANNEITVELIDKALQENVWQQAQFSKDLHHTQWKLLAVSIYALYRIQGKYPEEISKKIEVFHHSEKFLPAVRFMCRDKSVLSDVIKYYTPDFARQLATWSPESVGKNSQPQVNFKDISSHDMLQCITQAMHMLQYITQYQH